LEVLRIINEPTAAAIAYGLDNSTEASKTVLIFDLGGGTFDVSLLSIHKGIFTVKATAGDTHLGGEDFDHNLVEHFKAEFKRQFKSDLSQDARALRRLRTACERAKRSLSTLSTTTVEIDGLFEGNDFTSTISRAKFESLNMTLFNNTLETVKKVLKDAKCDKAQVDEIVLVGGSTRIPKIQSLLQEYFGGKELCKSINPDEAVACGAAVQAAVLTGTGSAKTEDLLLLDVVPLSLGVEMEGGIMAVVVPRNTPIPTIKKRTFTTAEDNQTTVEFPIYEGERTMTRDNNLLGNFELTGVPPAPRGVAELECVFDLNADGILKVTATEKSTGRRSHITLNNAAGRLSGEEIERMIKEAETFKNEDDKARAKVDGLHDFQNYVYSLQNNLMDLESKLKAKDMDTLENALSDAMQWLDVKGKNAEVNEISSYQKKLERTAQKVFATLYKR
jgi:L1 cell adhesion molecule like protein